MSTTRRESVQTRKRLYWLSILAAIASGLANAADSPSQPDSMPTPLLTTPSNAVHFLEQRRAQQLAAAQRTRAYHDFLFTDRITESGIRFQHHAVEDANKHYRADHYDHGSGIAVADVDGDGRLDILFVNQLGGNQLWRNLGNGRFEDTTASAGIALADRVCVGASFADIDNDGDPDLFITSVRGGNVLFENLGNGKFRDITAQAGVDYVGHSSGAVFFDFDNDGLVDLFVANVGRYTSEERGTGGYYIGLKDAFKGQLFPERAEQSILYRNLGRGKFADVSKEKHLQDLGWSGDASFADLNGDGFPDVYVLNMQGDNHYYENRGGKDFVERTATYFPKTPWGAMGIKFFDFNQDGRLDLFITDMHSDMTDLQTQISRRNGRLEFERQKSEQWCIPQWGDAVLQGASNNIFGNALYLNLGAPPFAEMSDQIGAETFWPWGLSVGDVNADGYDDAFIVAGMGFGFRYAINSLLLNEAGVRFAPSEFVLGIEPRAGGRVDKVSFVLDCSGADKDHPYCKGRTGLTPFREALSSRSSVMFDLDDDGDLDIITNEMNDRPQVLVSNLSEKKRIHYLKVKLVGKKSNRDGLGAFVQVEAGGNFYSQQNDGKSGHLSQSSMPLYFGLGDAEKFKRVTVKWPSGKKQVIEDGAINRMLIVQED